jgi:nucleoid-associated protein YgaU
MITILSRYERDEQYLDENIIAAVRKPVDKVYVQKYTVQGGESLESIAAKIYGDPTQFWRIADLNPQIKFPLDLTSGMVIRIPQ